MLARTSPQEAYRRSLLDARVQGAGPAGLVSFCLEQAILALGQALHAAERDDPARRSAALTRALTALTALEMGVDRNAPLADALLQLYGAARQAVLDSATAFASGTLATVRADLAEVDAALNAAA